MGPRSVPSVLLMGSGRLRFWVLSGTLIGCILSNAGCSADKTFPGPGISWRLAEDRKERLSDLRYSLHFWIPADATEPIRGAAEISFTLATADSPLAVDFAQPPSQLLTVTSNETPVSCDFRDGHVLLPVSSLKRGENSFHFEFVAGDGPLNRNPDFLYTLFVPDRAHEAFPCFDQPNLKARYRLSLRTPADWLAVSNSPVSTQSASDGENWEFSETEPLSTYHFAFAAGRFETDVYDAGNRVLTMYHRETDRNKLARNREAIFELHKTALEWLEQYTGIPYPFEKFGFVLIPSFQYGGMEHPGSVLYRAEAVLLDESATQNQLLGRASLIAHETAHMWFGNFVTMNWFDDVWTKEVFANFMAAKIVNPSFPEINHPLRFLLAHHPAAYAVDRSAGANPIRQRLDNLDEAGSLYGAIIYQKAPIVMRQLETLMGEQPFRQGLRDYLAQHRYGNATWPDLVAALNRSSKENLQEWSRVWVEESGRPLVKIEPDVDSEGHLTAIRVIQADPAGENRVWPQALELALGDADAVSRVWLQVRGKIQPITDGLGRTKPSFLLAGADGLGYADFQLDPGSQAYLLQHLSSVQDPLLRAVAWLSLWEGVLSHRLDPDSFLETALSSLPLETEELTIQAVLGCVEESFWRFLDTEQQTRFAPRLEDLCWTRMTTVASKTLKATYFNAYRDLASTSAAAQRLQEVWNRQLTPPDLVLSEEDDLRLAAALAIREPDQAEQILGVEMQRIKNPDRRARFLFLLPSLSSNQAVRDAFFESLRDLSNRRREAWALEGLSYLHHPLRAQESIKYIRPSLELLEEIQRTGDIFFPKRWLDATLGGHHSPEAAAIVNDYLADHPKLPARLRGKLLQSADTLYRAAQWRRP